ncbi:MAG: ParB/RepB/Spo0J family partition protein [Vibrio splendidus]
MSTQDDNHGHSPMLKAAAAADSGDRTKKKKLAMDFGSVAEPKNLPTGDFQEEPEKEDLPTGDFQEVSQVETRSPDGRSGKKDQLLYLKLEDISPWKFANRPDEEFGSEEEWTEFVNSIQKEGVLQPVVVRKKGKKYELIVGRRRYTAACLLDHSVIPAVVKTLSDSQAATIQEQENEKRNAISTWSRAISWQTYLDEGVFDQVKKLGVAFSLKPTEVNKVMVYAKIPKPIADSISNKFSMSNHLAQEIVNYTKVTNTQTKKDVEKNIEAIVAIGKDISDGKIKIGKFKAYMMDLNGEKVEKKEEGYDKSIGIVSGVKMFSLRKDSNGSPNIVLLKEARNFLSEEEIAQVISDALEEKMTKP